MYAHTRQSMSRFWFVSLSFILQFVTNCFLLFSTLHFWYFAISLHRPSLRTFHCAAAEAHAIVCFPFSVALYFSLLLFPNFFFLLKRPLTFHVVRFLLHSPHFAIAFVSAAVAALFSFEIFFRHSAVCFRYFSCAGAVAAIIWPYSFHLYYLIPFYIIFFRSCVHLSHCSASSVTILFMHSPRVCSDTLKEHKFSCSGSASIISRLIYFVTNLSFSIAVVFRIFRKFQNVFLLLFESSELFRRCNCQHLYRCIQLRAANEHFSNALNAFSFFCLTQSHGTQS